jgi:hypothetical protein
VSGNRSIPGSDDPPNRWRRFRSWWRDTKPTDAIGAVFGVVSVVIAALALWQSNQTANRQTDFEQEQSAPVLAPGTPSEVRGKTITVDTEFRRVTKRADRMLLRREPRGHLVVPMRNGGAGIALTVGLPLLVEDCVEQPQALPSTTVGLLGTYSVPSGSYEQLAYFQPHGKEYANGSVQVDGQSRWYGWDYARFGQSPEPTSTNVLVWYTDGARRKLRWTCTTYSAAKRTADGEQFAVQAQVYGSRDFPEEADTIAGAQVR